MDVRIPSAFLRTSAVYRSWGTSGQRLGVGFWAAPDQYSEEPLAPDYWALGLVLTGRGHFSGHDLAPGCAYVRFPGQAGRLSIDSPGYAECWLDLGGILAAVPTHLGLTDPARPFFTPGLDVSLVRRWDRLLSAAHVATIPELPLLTTDVLAITSEIVSMTRRRGADPHADLVTAACRLLDDGADRTRLIRLAASHSLSYERFRKIFKAHAGCPPGVYRIRQRIDRARTLLRTTDLTIGDISALVGCASAATFSLQFKSMVGTAPDIWRR